jgi:uncharacterized Fe-S radical SAM superfamily protein PflX
MTIPFEYCAEMYQKIDDYIVEHAMLPQKLHVSFGFFTWLYSVQEDRFLYNVSTTLPESFTLSTYLGAIVVVVNPALHSKEIILE